MDDMFDAPAPAPAEANMFESMETPAPAEANMFESMETPAPVPEPEPAGNMFEAMAPAPAEVGGGGMSADMFNTEMGAIAQWRQERDAKLAAKAAEAEAALKQKIEEAQGQIAQFYADLKEKSEKRAQANLCAPAPPAVACVPRLNPLAMGGRPGWAVPPVPHPPPAPPSLTLASLSPSPSVGPPPGGQSLPARVGSSSQLRRL